MFSGLRYSTYSTYSKDSGESGCSAACLVRHSRYSTYSKDPGDCEGSAAWCLPRLASPAAPPARHSLQPAKPAPRSGFFHRLRSTPRSDFRLPYFARKTHHRASAEGASASHWQSVFYHSHALPSILGWAQDCSCQSCCGNRIASTIPVLTTGLPRCATSSSGLELFLPEHRLVMESARL